MNRTIGAFILLVSSVALAVGQTVWEGTAATARYGEFPPGGYYAASSAFSRNAIVELTNTATGQSIEVIVVRRSEDPGILMLLSQEAASALGVAPGSPVQVQARRLSQPDLTRVGPTEDLPFSPDPDINPAAAAGDPNEDIVTPPSDDETGVVETEQPEPERPGPEIAERDEPTQPEEVPEAAPRRSVIPVPRDVPEEEEPTIDREPPAEVAGMPERRVVPVPRLIPPRDEAEPEVATGRPAVPSSRGVVPVPSRRPPVGAVDDAAREESPAAAEEPAESPSRTVIPVPSRRPPAAEEPPEPAESLAVDADVGPRRGLASGVTEAAGGLTVRTVERPELVFRRPEAVDPGADVTIADPDSPRPPAIADEPAVSPPEEAPVVVAENPLDRAIAAVVGRMPRDELFPPPRSGDVATLLRRPATPPEEGVADSRLAEAQLPEDERDEEPEIVDAPVEPMDPASTLLPRPDAPERSVRGPLADARARIEDPEIADRRSDPGEDAGGALAAPRLREPEGPALVDRVGPPDEDVDVAVAAPMVEDGPSLVEDDLDAGELVPDDAILALESADFRPPPIPEAEAGLARREPEDAAGIAETETTPAVPETPEALARAQAEGEDVDGRRPAPGLPPTPEELARLGVDEAPLIAEAREPSPPAEPEPSPPVEPEPSPPAEPEPSPPAEPEPGMRTEADDAPPIVEREDRPSAVEGPPTEAVEMAEVRAIEAPVDDLADWARMNLPLIGKLSSGAYYLQVGAYASPRGAKSAIEGLDQEYPVAVLPSGTAERTVYRLFVGPLNEDERGTMLFWFRARGFKDAFLRKGE